MSAILSADDLNDFISPGVACIKPVESLPVSTDETNTVTTNATSAAPPAQISLTDCLACSGCVTSAEAVLVSLQSHSEVLTALDAGPGLRLRNDGTSMVVDGLAQAGKLYIASVSPQTRASIAATYGTSKQEAGFMIEQLLRGPRGIRNRGVYRNTFQWVVDTNIAREACLVLGADEVLRSIQPGSEGRKLPILTSACPGWVCYAEKTHPHVLPHLSTLKSPQALMGTILKTGLSKALGISPKNIWHVAIMPCFDKKLEASRVELTDAAWIDGETQGVRDVDCVITSKELLMLADSRGVDFGKLPRTPLPQYMQSPFPDPQIHKFLFPSPKRRRLVTQREAGTSGGYLHHVLQQVASHHPGSTIQVSKGRNVDVADYSVISSTGQTIFKAARYYGFRNIQNLVRRLKPVTTSRMPAVRSVESGHRLATKPAGPDHRYVEVMACPGGCTNGGGQIKLDDPVVSGRQLEDKRGAQEQKEWLAQVDEAYFSGEECDDPFEEESPGFEYAERSTYIHTFLDHWSSMTGIPQERLAYTSYRAVVSDVGKKVSDTERAIEIASKIGGGW